MPNHLPYFEYARFRCSELVVSRYTTLLCSWMFISLNQNPPALSHEDDELFRASLKAKTPSQLARAASTWESLLERHQTPFLMVRVADVRASLGSFQTALELYSMVRPPHVHRPERGSLNSGFPRNVTLGPETSRLWSRPVVRGLAQKILPACERPGVG